MFIRYSISSIILGLSLLHSNAGASDQIDDHYQLQYESYYLYGHSTYEIGGLICNSAGCSRFFFPISKLEFPINMLMAGFSFQKKFTSVNLTTHLSYTIADKTGTFKDSDYVNAPGSLDIYSESKSNATALIASISLDKPVFQYAPDKILLLGIEFSVRHFNFYVEDTDQVSSVPGFCTCFTSGPTISYKVNYYIPSIYTQVPLLASKDIELDFKYAFSPITMVIDKDIHLARGKTSRGRLYGFTNTFDLSATFRTSPSSDIIVNLRNVSIRTEGTQTQVQASQLDTDVDEKVYSSQWSLKLSIQTTF